jgi:hypothetical protein
MASRAPTVESDDAMLKVCSARLDLVRVEFNPTTVHSTRIGSSFAVAACQFDLRTPRIALQWEPDTFGILSPQLWRRPSMIHRTYQPSGS